MDPATGLLLRAIRVDKCDAPMAVAVFDHRYALLFRYHALASSVLLTGALYDNKTDHQLIVAHVGARVLDDLAYVVDPASLTVMRSRRGLVAPLLACATFDGRVVAFPFHPARPPVLLSHARRFADGLPLTLQAVPREYESQVELRVRSATGAEWNVTVTPDGAFDTVSLHDTAKQAALLGVLAALVVVTAASSYWRRGLPLRLRWA